MQGSKGKYREMLTKVVQQFEELLNNLEKPAYELKKESLEDEEDEE